METADSECQLFTISSYEEARKVTQIRRKNFQTNKVYANLHVIDVNLTTH